MKKLIALLTALAMCLTLIGMMPVIAAESSDAISDDFEAVASDSELLAAYTFPDTVNGSFTLVQSADRLGFGEKSAAVTHISANDAGGDVYFYKSFDFTKDSVLSFDIKRTTNATPKVTIADKQLIRNTWWSTSMVTDTWYRYTYLTTYNSETKTLNVTCYINGVLSYENSAHTFAEDPVNVHVRLGLDVKSNQNHSLYVDNLNIRHLGEESLSDVNVTAKNDMIKLDFGNDLDASSVDTSSLYVEDSIGMIKETESIVVSGNSILVTMPANTLENTTYTVTLPRGITDISGYSVSDSGLVHSFTYVNNKVPSVYIASPVNGSLLEKAAPVKITADASVGSGSLESVDFYADGALIGTDAEAPFECEYIPEAFGHSTVYATACANGYEKTSDSVEYKISEVTVKTDKWDFTSPAPSSYAASGWTALYRFSVDGGQLNYIAESQPWTIAERQTNAAYGAALGFTSGGGRLNLNMPASLTATDIVVAVEFDVYFTSSDIGINAAFTNGSAWDVAAKFDAASGRLNSGSYSEAYSGGKWYNVKVVYAVGEAYSVYVDGKQICGNAACNPAITAFNQIRFETNFKSGGAGEVYIDNVGVKTYIAPLNIIGTEVKNSDGDILTDSSLIASDIAAIEASFDQTLDLSSVSSDTVKLYRGTDNLNPVPADVTLSEDGRVIIVTPESGALTSSAHYRLVISESITAVSTAAFGKEYEYSFRTVIEEYGMQNPTFIKGNSELLTTSGLAEGDIVSFKAEVRVPKDSELWVVIAAYVDDELTDMKFKTVNISANSIENIATSLILSETPAEGTVIRGFVWTSDLVPLGDFGEVK